MIDKYNILNKDKSTEEHYVIREGVTTLSQKHFRRSKSLKSVVIPKTVTCIKNETFAGCESLTNIEIPNSVTDIGYGAFLGCSSLKEIEIPDSVTCIKADTFKDCTSLEKITIPESVTSISENAFYFCPSLHNFQAVGFTFTSIESTFENYYKKQFERDLTNWFKITTSKHDGSIFNFIPSAKEECGFHRQHWRCSDSNFHEYCFSIACFYTFLIPQVVTKITNDSEGKYLFAQSSGWPLLSCGLGGFMSPAQILMEAKLEPYPNERSRYYPLLQKLLPFFKNEVKDFLQGNALNLNGDAYRRLCELTNGKVDSILEEMEVQVSDYISYLKGDQLKFDKYLLNHDQLYGASSK